MAQKLEGGCTCGAVRYRVRPLPDSGYYCHCRDCQVGSGSAFSVSFISRQADFHLESGSPATWSKTADSGNRIDRLFCAHCGTPLFWMGEGFAGQVVVTASSLDDPERIRPASEIWVDSRVSWCRIAEDLASSPGKPADPAP